MTDTKKIKHGEVWTSPVTKDKNTFDPATPEWQLFENMKSSELLSVSAAADAERYTKQAQAARDKAARYRAALEKLLS